uniref:Double-stranded RNA-specific editase Adar n=1 Tax=Clastoptera arizonana TaxID=38151 RepID=A0A1B6D181_9HEMI
MVFSAPINSVISNGPVETGSTQVPDDELKLATDVGVSIPDGIQINEEKANWAKLDSLNSNNDQGKWPKVEIDEDVISPLKRSVPLIDSGSPARKRKRRNANSVPMPKNAVCLLNELRPGLLYDTIGQTGPVHCPTFTISVKIDGQEVTGQGRTKKLAKQAAAEAALRTFIQFPDMHETSYLTPCLQRNSLDFTNDVSLTDNSVYNALKPESFGKAENVSEQESFLKPVTLPRPASVMEKSPVMLLNEMRSGLKYECTSNSGELFAKFTMSVTIDDKVFEGTGPSKKLAKAAAARSALSSLYDLTFNPTLSSHSSSTSTITTPGSNSTLLFVIMPSHQADVIARLVLNKYAVLMENDSSHARRKVLAGIVMTRGPPGQLNNGEVISIGTGTKCVGGEHMSVRGAALNDSHAEIVAKRGLCLFLYKQLELLANPDSANDSIFEPNVDKGGYKLRDDVKFHLFINTAPCGDSRIFSPHEAECIGDESFDKHPNRNSRGQLRTKIESGEGTIPVKSSAGIQTWDGVLQGQRLLTMSCSDKIARWNVVGVQGSLLTIFIEPIYLESIVLGSLFNPSHMYRAVCGRIESSVQALPPPYRLNKPQMGVTSSPEVRQPGKAPNHSVNWIIGEERVEVINAMTGKAELGAASRLCKQGLYKRFCSLIGRISTITEFKKEDIKTLLYDEIKANVKDYQAAKNQLFQAFQKAELGMWLKKPVEQDQFFLEESVFAAQPAQLQNLMITQQ